MAQRIKELDALRGIAALFIVLIHYTMGRPEAVWGFKIGVPGVDLFFIISGFVIFMRIQKTKSTIEFVINRFTRFYPTYWTCVSITALLQLALLFSTSNNSTHLSITQYLANLTMFQHYFQVNDIDGSYWTMIIEMVFYLFIILLLSLKQSKYILQISLIILSMIGVYSFVLDSYFPSIQDHLVYWCRLYSHFPLFVAGIIFYQIQQQKGKWFINYILLAACFIVQSNLYDHYTKIAYFITQQEYTILLSLYFCLFILFVNHKLKFIISKPALYLGKISFALYLIHQYISTEIIIPQLLKHGINFWIAAIIALSVCVILASIITYFIEIPVGKKLNKSLRKHFNIPVIHT